jgi:hypothetical protein
MFAVCRPGGTIFIADRSGAGRQLHRRRSISGIDDPERRHVDIGSAALARNHVAVYQALAVGRQHDFAERMD